MDFVNQSVLGMFIIFFFSLLLLYSFSPLSLSFSLIIYSFFCSALIYFSSLSIFSFSVIVISFSSGMMILFLYCSMMVNYEASGLTFLYTFIVFLYMLFFCFNISLGSFFSSSFLDSTIFLFSPFLLWGLCFVWLSLVSLNSILFHPLKSFGLSY